MHLIQKFLTTRDNTILSKKFDKTSILNFPFHRIQEFDFLAYELDQLGCSLSVMGEN